MDNGVGAGGAADDSRYPSPRAERCPEQTEPGDPGPDDAVGDPDPASLDPAALRDLGDEIVRLSAELQADADRLAELRAQFDRRQK